MNLNDDKRINLPIPFLKEKTVVYIDGGSGYAHRAISRMADILHFRFARASFKFIFLPDLMEHLTPDILQYLFPGQKDIFSVVDLYRRIQNLATLGNHSGFIYRRDGVAYFHIIPDCPEEDVEKAILHFIDAFGIAESMAGEANRNMVETAIECNDACFSLPRRKEAAKPSVFDNFAEDLLDPRISAILAAWEKIERDFGITIEDLDLILGYRVKLSRLSIMTAGRILLSDFGNQEVKMDDLTKSIYYFYLRHPEGATIKELHEHQDEILKYYSGITGRDDMDGIRKSIENLLDPYANNLNVSMSRIKKAFRDVVGDRVARFYYIDGRSGEPRKILLDRDLVIWEH